MTTQRNGTSSSTPILSLKDDIGDVLYRSTNVRTFRHWSGLGDRSARKTGRESILNRSYVGSFAHDLSGYGSDIVDEVRTDSASLGETLLCRQCGATSMLQLKR